MADTPSSRSRSYLLGDARTEASEAARLHRQAQALFALEAPALAEHGLAAGQTIVDLGCGQGSYLGLVAAAFPGSRCVGLDRNPGLLERARSVPGVDEAAGCDLADGDGLRAILERLEPDAVYCRLVFQHMNPAERSALLAALRAQSSRKPLRVIVIDVDAASGYFEPDSPLIADARRQLAAQQTRDGGDRTIGARLRELLDGAGFGGLRASRVSVSSEQLGFGTYWEAFGQVLCGSLRGRPSAREAMMEWGRDAGTAARWRCGFQLCFASGH